MKGLLVAVTIGVLAALSGHPAHGAGWPENDQVKVLAAAKMDCFVYQADCLRVTVLCKRFIPLGRPILEVRWLDADGSAFYTVVKHIAGNAHCNKGDLIQRYVPFYEGKQFTITLH